jgi:hypothetical protein
MDNQYFGKTEDRKLFSEIINLFAFFAFKVALVHPFGVNIAPQAFWQVNIASDLNTSSRYGNTEIHKIIERQAFMATALTFHFIDQLSSE